MTSYSYDAAGNLLNDGPHQYTYDDENRVSTATLTGGGTETYSYDGEGKRIRKTNGITTEEYVYDSEGHEVGEMTPNGTFNRSEIYASGRHLATYDLVPAQTIFIHDDWQGTERVRSKYDGSSYETCTNLPYGDNQNCVVVGGGNDPSPLHYTGKMRDVETTLDYFGARYYSSGMGHWMSPDWADKPTSVPYANFGVPQSLNLYGYVMNNPLNHTDKDGHCPLCQLMDSPEGQQLEEWTEQAMALGTAWLGSHVFHSESKGDNSPPQAPEAPKDEKLAPAPLPANPDDLKDKGYTEASHPEAKEAGHRTFEKPGDKVRHDKGKPGAPGNEGEDHYHRYNPNSSGKGDQYLDSKGNPVPRGSPDSHLKPAPPKEPTGGGSQ